MDFEKQSAKIEEKAAAAGVKMQLWRDSLMRWLLSLTTHWQKRGTIVANNFALGMTYLKSGHVRDAVMRFKIVTWMEPSRADAWYYLGCSYLAAGEKNEAKAALAKSLQLKPGNEEANYMLAIASGSAMPAAKRPRKMPLSLSFSHFEARAAGFEREQLEDFQHQGHVLLSKAIHAGVVQGRMDHVVLEIGAGTGLMGPHLRDITAHLTGVDMSGNMLAEAVKLVDANGKKIYDALIKREAHDFLAGVADNAFDMVVACGVLSYIGELDRLVAQIARVLKPGGMFAFTADKLEGNGFELDPDLGRFRFSANYLQALAGNNRLKPVKLEEVEIYVGFKGWLGIFSK